MTLAQHTFYMTIRHVRELLRQPWWIAVTLVQPVIWLLLFGALFKRVVEIPGFHGGSYIAFLAPGVVVMTAMFNSAWSGMALIEDLNRGVTARFLVSPVRRQALIAGRIAKEAVVVVIQSVISAASGVRLRWHKLHRTGDVAAATIPAQPVAQPVAQLERDDVLV